MKDLKKGKAGKTRRRKKRTKLSPEIDRERLWQTLGIGDWWESEGGRQREEKDNEQQKIHNEYHQINQSNKGEAVLKFFFLIFN